MAVKCPLCHCYQTQNYFQDKHSDYLSCSQCDLVFAPKAFHLSDSAEKARYDLHKNSAEDASYRQFLSQVFDPVIQLIKPSNKGLDFGCGPGPALSVMFTEQGYEVDLFDKFYANDPSIFDNKYDFITATEVAEHLAQPGDELTRLYGMLNNGGVLAIMTKFLNADIDFESWYYKNDPTHICFFSKVTIHYLAKLWGADIKFYNENVVAFLK